MKHTSWLSGLAAVRSPRRRAWARTSSLVMSPTGKTTRASASWSEHGQHVGLVLGGVGAPRAGGTAVRAGDPGVVPGGQAVEAEPVGPAQQAVELDGAVALDAGVGRPPRACSST